MNDDGRETTLIGYATPGLTARPPFNWGGAVRQFVFALGIGLLSSGACLALMHDTRDDPTPAVVGVGAAMVALTLPWPGRVGRHRPPRGAA